MCIYQGDSAGSAKQYRLYFLDGAGRVAAPAYEFEAEGDQMAMKVAEAWREGRKIELWCGRRKLGIS